MEQGPGPRLTFEQTLDKLSLCHKACRHTVRLKDWKAAGDGGGGDCGDYSSNGGDGDGIDGDGVGGAGDGSGGIIDGDHGVGGVF